MLETESLPTSLHAFGGGCANHLSPPFVAQRHQQLTTFCLRYLRRTLQADSVRRRSFPYEKTFWTLQVPSIATRSTRLLSRVLAPLAFRSGRTLPVQPHTHYGREGWDDDSSRPQWAELGLCLDVRKELVVRERPLVPSGASGCHANNEISSRWSSPLPILSGLGHMDRPLI